MFAFVRSPGRQHQTTTARVHAAAGAATRIVEQKMRGRIGPIDLAVASSSGMWDLVADAHRPMFGRRDPQVWQHDRHAYGTTTITATGVLVVINAQACRGRQSEIDKTLLHELTHALQFNRPGARKLIEASIANNYGIRPMTEREAQAANRQVDADERQAARMERHHRQLAQSI
ncbi:hypothetical protein OH540_09415 [Streptomyces sp. BPPL-273]|uniref:hypothetical protein n=1 Tax=Streptomyces sp. BPPL-273 TaxID=2987533 RepID=UPI0024AF7279|nr:hypothetical protein [Streptomyces sp. BPPL-273]WHM30240.1 hypothetical protein OH540_09415 [Streptomyces sp. BPPL-273]